MGLTKQVLRRPVTTLLVVLCLIVFGLSSITSSKLELIPEIELNNNDLLIDLARIGLGIAIIPDYCLTDKNQDLIILHTREQIPARYITASVNPSLPVLAPTEEFLKLLPEV